MFANTLSVTIDAVAYTLLRNNQDNFGSNYEFVDGTRAITMKIRHKTESFQGKPQNSHNVLFEHRIYATPTVAEKYYSVSCTLREAYGSDPAFLLKTWQGFNTLFLTLDDTFVAKDN